MLSGTLALYETTLHQGAVQAGIAELEAGHMRPIDFFDNGHDQNPDAVCLIQDETGREYTYA